MEQGLVQVHYQSRFIGLHSGGTVCMGCDEPITEVVCVGYWSLAGARRWFHVRCDAARQAVATRLFLDKVRRLVDRHRLTFAEAQRNDRIARPAIPPLAADGRSARPVESRAEHGGSKDIGALSSDYVAPRG